MHCRGFTMEMAWAISEIKGEAAAEESRCPDGPSPVWGPESVVCGQLQALRQAPRAISGMHSSLRKVVALSSLERLSSHGS